MFYKKKNKEGDKTKDEEKEVILILYIFHFLCS
jgi:hypothetical protein